RLARSFDQMTVALQERSAAEQNAQAERLRIQQVLIDAQHHRIEELTTPTIPLGHGTLLLPLIGSIDQDRAARVLLTLLADVHTQRAQNLIIDLSGIHIVDAQVMAVLVSAARAVRLLGARVTLVGIRAEAAHTLVDLELDLSDITIYANLHDAFDAER
ncbi:MAG: STAS domain-containing protein, partial [Oscillochloris sp.]|nr:STAS domain-containing protein [Oscillochloris sp.]